MALQMRSPSNSWSQAFYGHTSLQITSMAKTQLHTQVFCHIPDSRIKFLMWEVEPKVCPDKSLQKWVKRLTFLSLSISISPLKVWSQANWKLWASGTPSNSTENEGRAVSVFWSRQTEQERPVLLRPHGLHPRAILDTSFHFKWMYKDRAIQLTITEVD